MEFKYRNNTMLLKFSKSGRKVRPELPIANKILFLTECQAIHIASNHVSRRGECACKQSYYPCYLYGAKKNTKKRLLFTKTVHTLLVL